MLSAPPRARRTPLPSRAGAFVKRGALRAPRPAGPAPCGPGPCPPGDRPAGLAPVRPCTPAGAALPIPPG
ncbi:hypothetical protein EF912_07020 [Streptomyces sp. WAC07061]|nr:hypothetical protein EF912_07020 [Streptomyces sp. WAC07061]